MKLFISRLLLLILLIAGYSCTKISDNSAQREQVFYKYVGIYSDRANNNYKVIVKEQDGKLYIKDWRVKDEITIENDIDFRLKNFPIEGHFNNLEHRRYQDLSFEENGTTVRLSRSEIPLIKYEDAIYESIDNLIKIDENKTEAESPIEIKMGTVSEVNGDAESINDLIEKFKNGYFGKQNSLLIMKDGKLVVEQYFRGWSREENQSMYSVSKSFTSLLLGDALAKGFIDSVNDPISKYLPEYTSILAGEKEKITIKDLLTMSAGLDWDEWSTSCYDSNNIRNRETSSVDSVEFTLSLPLVNEIGEVFTYSSGYVTVIGEIIKNATGAASLADFAGQSSLLKLCLKNAYWFEQVDGRQDAGAGLKLRPLDMAKIGQIVLDKGIWNDQRIIDEAWIRESTTTHILTNSNIWGEYGYYWWSKYYNVNGKKYRAVAACGGGGQHIIIIEDLNLVVVTTAENFGRRKYDDAIMSKFIIPAFQ
ncbi:MAG: serine hydrolase [Spirochaetales bacterium]|nr:serine hydrolase [Spirochaetales bacterium]